MMIDYLADLATRLPSLPRIWARHVLFWVGAVAVASIAILFAKGSTYGNQLFLDIIQHYKFLVFLLTPLGFCSIVWITQRYFVGAEGSGIPQVIAAIDAPEIADRASVLSLRVAFGKVLLTTLGLCAGASVGREGPTVQIGAAIMYAFSKRLRLPPPHIRRALILAGGAAGIASAFNTPLAGIIFAIEELSRSFEEHANGTILTSVIIAGIVSIYALGNYTYFGHTDVILPLTMAWKPVLLCGIVGGLLGGVFSRILILFSESLPPQLSTLTTKHSVLFAAGCGFLIALLGWFSDFTIFGTGYNEARGLLEGTRELPASFAPLKLLATVLSYISGIPGGLFAPSLAVGAGLGSDLVPYMPEIPVGAVIILGMVGYFTGVVQVPLTATIIVMEMTDDQSLTLPLLATAFVAMACSRLVCPSTLYHSLAHRFLSVATRRSPRPATTAPAAPTQAISTALPEQQAPDSSNSQA